MQIIQVEQGTDAWHAARLGNATASRFADIMATVKSGESASRRNYRMELVLERITGQREQDGFKSNDMQRGTELEPEARMAYMAFAGVGVQQVGICMHDTLRAGASPDGLIGHDQGLEIKCPKAATHWEYINLPSGAAPNEYVAQIQGGMWITGRSKWEFVTYHPKFPEKLRLVTRTIARDDAYIARLAVEVQRFLEEVSAQEDSVRRMAA